MMKGNIEKKPKRKDIFSKLNFKLNLGGEDPGKIVKRRTHRTFVSAISTTKDDHHWPTSDDI